MTDDLVKRLRDTTGIHDDLLYEAADRIEQLEAALREIADNNSVRAGLDNDMYRRWRRVATNGIDIARAALDAK